MASGQAVPRFEDEALGAGFAVFGEFFIPEAGEGSGELHLFRVCLMPRSFIH